MSSGRHAFQTCICSLIGFNSYFVLYLMCCFGNNPLYMDFKPIKILFCANVSSVFKVSLFTGNTGLPCRSVVMAVLIIFLFTRMQPKYNML